MDNKAVTGQRRDANPAKQVRLDYETNPTGREIAGKMQKNETNPTTD
jgi:hypothetical protein